MPNSSDSFLILLQHFIGSDLMEDGQENSKFAPDREEDDPADFEYNGEVPPSESTDEGESSGESSESETPDDDADNEAPTPETPTSDLRHKGVRPTLLLSNLWLNGVMTTTS